MVKPASKEEKNPVEQIDHGTVADLLHVNGELAIQMRKLSAAVKAFENGALKSEAIIILLRAQTGLPKRDIVLLLNAIKDMPRTWLKANSSNINEPTNLDQPMTI